MEDLFDNIPDEESENGTLPEDQIESAPKTDEISDLPNYDEILDIIQNMSGAAKKAEIQRELEKAEDGSAAEESSEQLNEDGDVNEDAEQSDDDIGETEPFIPKVSIGKITDKIKKSRILDSENLKDMFFGSQSDDDSAEADNIDDGFKYDEGYEEDQNQPILFDKSRKKRITADPDNDKMIFSFEYMITPGQASDGYMLFYNEFIRRRNVKWTVFLGIAAAALLITLAISPKNYLSWLLLLICAAAAAMMWITAAAAKKDAKNSADAVKNDSYKLTFYNSRIVIEASELVGDRIYHYQPVMIRFEDIDLKVIDYDDIYVLIFKKDYIYTVPKDAMTEQMNSIFRRHLSNILGDDYREYYDKNTDKPEDGEKASDDVTETERE